MSGEEILWLREQDKPLAEVEELEELKRRYRVYSSAVLRAWTQAVTGSHRTAMLELLRERGEEPAEE